MRKRFSRPGCLPAGARETSQCEGRACVCELKISVRNCIWVICRGSSDYLESLDASPARAKKINVLFLGDGETVVGNNWEMGKGI